MRLFRRFSSLIAFGTFGLAMMMGGPLCAAGPISGPPALEELIAEGLVQNRELQSISAEIESLKESVSFAGSLDDPRLGIGLLNVPTDTFSFSQEPMTQKQLFIAQKIPWFGKLGLREQRQALAVTRRQAYLAQKRIELSRKIASAYYELAFIDASLETNRRMTELLNQLLKVAETRYATGKGLQQDVLQAQVELSKRLDEKISLQKRRRIAEDNINGLLNRDGFSPVPPSADLPAVEMKVDVAALQAQSLQGNPLLLAKQAEVDLAQVEAQLAEKDYWPDMDFVVAYGQRDEDSSGRNLPDFVSGSVVINIPLWQKSRQDRNLASKLKGLEAARKSYDDLVKTLPHRVDSLVTDIRGTEENRRLFSDALTLQAQHWAEASTSAYVVGEMEFNSMLNAQIQLLNFELTAKKYLIDLYQKRADLEETLGGPISAQALVTSEKTP